VDSSADSNGTRIFAKHCGITAFAEYPRINSARCSGAAPSKPRDLPSGSKQGTTNQFGYSRHNTHSSKELRKSECHSRLTPIVNRALGYQLQLPARRPAELHEVLGTCPGLEFIIDGTERPIRRPKDSQRRREDSRGKKKRHTKKNIVITDKPTGKIKGLGGTRAGSKHDKACTDEEGYTFPEGVWQRFATKWAIRGDPSPWL
jgi:hypothetical protein